MPGEEIIDLVNEHDRVVGSASIRKCLEEGLLHRAVAVLVVRSSGRFVIQQRSKRDLWQPGLWTISSTGHVKSGEGYESAARREMNEELGLVGRVDFVRKYRMPPISDRGLTEREWVSLFTCLTDSPCRIDPGEVESVKEVTGDELRAKLADGSFTSDAKIILSDFLRRRL